MLADQPELALKLLTHQAVAEEDIRTVADALRFYHKEWYNKHRSQLGLSHVTLPWQELISLDHLAGLLRDRATLLEAEWASPAGTPQDVVRAMEYAWPIKASLNCLRGCRALTGYRSGWQYLGEATGHDDDINTAEAPHHGVIACMKPDAGDDQIYPANLAAHYRRRFNL